MIYKQKALFCTYVFTRTPNPQEFRRRRSLDNVQASSRLRRTFARENFTSGSRRAAISSSMLKFPNEALFALVLVGPVMSGKNILEYNKSKKSLVSL